MINVLKFFGFILIFVLVLGTGQLLVSQGEYHLLWQFFWIGLIVWIWGYIILIRLNEKEKLEDDSDRIKDAFLLGQKSQLDQLKIAALSALVSITFFYSSISWIFKDNLLISIIILTVTFLVSYNIQVELLRKKKEKS